MSQSKNSFSFIAASGSALILVALFCVQAAATAADHLEQGCEIASASSCALSAQEFPAWKGGGAPRIVDVRSEADFEMLRVPDSINFPIFALKTKTYLKQEKILLIGDAFQGVELEHACLALGQAGFKDVRYLEGGALSWSRKIGRLDGDRSSVVKLREVSPLLLFKEGALKAWVLVDMNLQSSVLEPQQLRIIHLPADGKAASFRNMLKERAAELMKKEPDLALVLMPPKNLFGEIDSWLAPELDGLFYLAGGREALKEYVRNNSAVLEHLAKRSKENRCR